MMKVNITVKFDTNPKADVKVPIKAGPGETVASLKERVASLQQNPFPDQDLQLNGKVLGDGSKLGDCGVKDGSALDLVVHASEETLVRQLRDLLQARDLSVDELSLLYCYKTGAAIGQALKLLGKEVGLQEFLKEQKPFFLENGRVTLVREDTSLRPFSIAEEVVRMLQATSTGSMAVRELSLEFARKFNVSMASVLGMRPADFLAKETSLFTVNARGIVSLKSNAGAPPPKGKASTTSKKPETPDPAVAHKRTESPDSDSAGLPGAQEYLDLHNRISGRTFNSRAIQVLNDTMDAISESLFLDVDHVVKGGSVGKGTAIEGHVDAQIIFFVKGLPQTGHRTWLPPLLNSAAAVLSERLSSHGAEDIRVTEDAVHMRVKDLLDVEVCFSPTFESYAATVQVLGEQDADARRFYAASLAKERTQLIGRQPGSVKVTMRLLKWWRDQQEWSGNLTRPSDEVLELAAVYSAAQSKPTDQRIAIANVMSLLARFNEVRIVWSNFYSKEDVHAPLLRQRPLLMDPTNPFVNVADPQAFDPRELMELAGTTHFFW